MGIPVNNHRKTKPKDKLKPSAFGTPSEAAGKIEEHMNRLLTNLETGKNIISKTYPTAIEMLEKSAKYSNPETYKFFKDRMANYHKKSLENLLQQLEQWETTKLEEETDTEKEQEKAKEKDRLYQKAADQMQIWDAFIAMNMHTERERIALRKEYNAVSVRLKQFVEKYMRTFFKTLEKGDEDKQKVYNQATKILEFLITLSSKTACKPIAKRLKQYKEIAK